MRCGRTSRDAPAGRSRRPIPFASATTATRPTSRGNLADVNRVAVVVCLLALGSCGPPSVATDAGTDGGAASDAGDDGGSDAGPRTLEVFADVGSRSEGIAIGRTPGGASVLYVGTSDDRIVRVAPDGVVGDFVSIHAPVGLTTRADGTLLVCAKQPVAMGEAAAIFAVTPDGTITTLVAAGPGATPFVLTNYVLEAPDGSIVFTDSGGDSVFRADADGSHVALVAAVSYANGLAFSPSGDTLYVASWDTTTLHALSFDATTGAYGAPTVAHDGIMNVDGIVTTSTGSLVLVTSAAGILEVDPATPTAMPRTLATNREVTLPANGVFGDSAFGTANVYLSTLGRTTISVLHTDRMAP